MSDTLEPRGVVTVPKPRRWQSVTRWRAFTVHFAASAAIVAAVCALIFFVWYPSPYFHATGVWRVLRVLIAVHLVLGPLLTLIVFKPGKKRLAFDLCFIGIIQLTALAFGVAVIYSERPYYTVFAVDRFYVLARTDVYEPELADPTLTAGERIGTKSLRGPLLLAATRPADAHGMNRLIDETVFGGMPDIERRPAYWTRYADRTATVLERARPVAELGDRQPAAARQIERALVRLDRADSTLAFLPVIARNRDFAMLIDATTAIPLAVLDVDPWERAAARD